MTALLKLSSSSNYPRGGTLGTVEGVDRKPKRLPDIMIPNKQFLIDIGSEGSSSLSEVPELADGGRLYGLMNFHETACVQSLGPPGNADHEVTLSSWFCHGNIPRRSTLLSHGIVCKNKVFPAPWTGAPETPVSCVQRESARVR